MSSIILFLGVNIMQCVLRTFSDNLLQFNHSCISRRSSFNWLHRTSKFLCELHPISHSKATDGVSIIYDYFRENRLWYNSKVLYLFIRLITVLCNIRSQTNMEFKCMMLYRAENKWQLEKVSRPIASNPLNASHQKKRRQDMCSWWNSSHGIKFPETPAPLLAVTPLSWYNYVYINGLVQACSISSAVALEILQSCTKPSTYSFKNMCFFSWNSPHYAQFPCNCWSNSLRNNSAKHVNIGSHCHCHQHSQVPVTLLMHWCLPPHQLVNINCMTFRRYTNCWHLVANGNRIHLDASAGT